MTIKKKLWLIAAMSIGALMICGGFVVYTFSKISDIDKLEEQVSELETVLYKMRQYGSNFVLHDLTKNDFYESGTTENIENF